jgi:hypothetical protein
MRVGFVRNVGLAALGLAVAVTAACNDDPLSFDNDTTFDIVTNPSSMTVPAGGTSKLTSYAVNQGGEPTWADVVPTLSNSCVGIEEDPDRLEIQPPGLFVVFGNTSLCTGVITLTAAGITTEISVSVVASELVLACPDVIRSEDTGTIDASLFADDGVTPVEPFDQTTDLAWSSDDEAVVTVDQSGNYVGIESGSATITAVWTGTAATGTDGIATREADCAITVNASVPASAAFADIDTLGSVGAYEVDSIVELEVLVFDAEGNLTNRADEITGVTVTSSQPAIATATAEVVVDPADGTASVIVTATGLTGGQTLLSGFVQTTEGNLPYEGVYSVVAPLIGSITPDPAAPGDTITIMGESLGFNGLTTEVFFNGYPATSVTVVTVNELAVVPPLMGNAGVVDVQISVSGVTSPTATYTEVGIWNSDDTEPENHAWPATVNVGFPLNFTGTLGEETAPDVFDSNDWFLVTVPENGTMNITLDWDTDADVDILINDLSSAPDFTIPPIVCSDGGTLAKPETTVCTVTAGSYVIWLADFGPGVSSYTVTGTF